MLHPLHTTGIWVAAIVAVGAAVGDLLWRRRRRRAAQRAAQRPALTRVEAHLSSSRPPVTPVTSMALRRDMQERFELREATYDLDVLDHVLRDIRDLTAADEAIFWRWVEARQTLVPSAWSTEGQSRPMHFDLHRWGTLVRACAEEDIVAFAGDDDSPILAAAPVTGAAAVHGVLTVTAATGLRLDRTGARVWMPRFAAQIATLLQLFDLRREYGRHMRQSDALLDAVNRLAGHRSPDALGQALCETARDVTSAAVASLVRWSAGDEVGVVQATTPAGDLEPGFHVTADSLVGQACLARLPLTLDDARAATDLHCPFGGLHRDIGSLAVVPILSDGVVIGALVVEGRGVGEVGQHEARNVGLLAAIARGHLEIVWEIEEVSVRARTDPLTGLANRRHFDEQLRRVVAETDRFGGRCSLILLDLDHFKSVNDRFGHEAGDAVLRHTARILTEGVRTVDLCARYGGEELAVLLPQTSEQGAAELAERLRTALARRAVNVGGAAVEVTASFGVATYPSPVPYGDWLILGADRALYEAKAAGRNCVKVIQANNVTPALYKTRR